MRRRILAAICAVILAVSGTACSNSGGKNGTDAAPLRFMVNYFDYSKYDPETGKTNLESRGNAIYCTRETAEAYPELAAELEKEAASSEKKAKEFAADEDETVNKTGEDSPYGTFKDTTYSVVKRADEKVVSIESQFYTYAGGAHPMIGYFTRNIDPVTGKEIKLADVVKDQKKLNELLLVQLRENYSDASFADDENIFAEYDMNVTASDLGHFAYNFTLDPDGICFYFSLYDLGTYADGVQTVKLLYRNTPDLFVEDYVVGGGYASGIIETGQYDIGGDGTKDEIRFYFSEDEFNQAYEKIYVVKNGQELVSDLYCYNADTFLMHTEDNRDYLYVIAHMDNDASCLNIYDLSGEKPTLAAETEYGLSYADWEERDLYGYELITESDDFTLSFRCDLLASFNACFNTSVGTDGKPILPEDGIYSVPDYIHSLQSAKPFKADIVDESGKVVEQGGEIPAGETFKLFRTDGKTVIDAKLSDGRIARLELTRSDDNYTATVNGQISEEEAFKELYYAG